MKMNEIEKKRNEIKKKEVGINCKKNERNPLELFQATVLKDVLIRKETKLC